MSKLNTRAKAKPGRAFQSAMSLRIAMLWQEVFTLLPKIRKGESTEAIHDARLATRRLRTVMDAAAAKDAKRGYRKLHGQAKVITRQLGRMRDYDVMLEQLAATRDRLDKSERVGNQFLNKRIRHERRRERKAMVKRLAPFASRQFRRQVRDRFGDVRICREWPEGDTQALAADLRPFLAQRAQSVLAFEPTLRTNDDPEVFHQARIGSES